MGHWFQNTAYSGSLVLARPIAIIVGLVSFFSPCVIPLLPAYLSYATGLSGADLAAGDVRRGRMLLGAALFVLGFSVVFVSIGVVGGSLSGWTGGHTEIINRILGAICVPLGLALD